MSIPRNPEEYECKRHAVDKANQRDIPLELVSETIKEGKLLPKPAHIENAEKRILNAEFGFAQESLSVVCNLETREVITVHWGLPAYLSEQQD